MGNLFSKIWSIIGENKGIAGKNKRDLSETVMLSKYMQMLGLVLTLLDVNYKTPVNHFCHAIINLSTCEAHGHQMQS